MLAARPVSVNRTPRGAARGLPVRVRASAVATPSEEEMPNKYVSQVISSPPVDKEEYSGRFLRESIAQAKAEPKRKVKAAPVAKTGFGGGGKAPPVAKRSDAELIKESSKEYDKLCEKQAKQNIAFLEYVVSVRDSGKGQLSDWLPICQLTVLLPDDDGDDQFEADMGFKKFKPDMHAVVCCAVSQRKAVIAALVRKVVGKSGVKGMLQFAYEPEASFRVALTALGGMEESAADAAMALLGLEAAAAPAAVRAAYRKAAALWHPDKFEASGDEERDAAKGKFQRIKEAYETLQSSRIQKGQLYADLGGGERDGFTDALSFESAAAECDVATARGQSAVCALMVDEAVTPFAVRNIMQAKRAVQAAAETANETA